MPLTTRIDLATDWATVAVYNVARSLISLVVWKQTLRLPRMMSRGRISLCSRGLFLTDAIILEIRGDLGRTRAQSFGLMYLESL